MGESRDLVVRDGTAVVRAREGESLPSLVERCGPAAVRAWRDFFAGTLPNKHTRAAYNLAVRRFLGWCQDRGIGLQEITAGDMGVYIREHPGAVPTVKQHLSGIRRYFNLPGGACGCEGDRSL